MPDRLTELEFEMLLFILLIENPGKMQYLDARYAAIVMYGDEVPIVVQ
jgi:hypothetical protein